MQEIEPIAPESPLNVDFMYTERGILGLNTFKGKLPGQHQITYYYQVNRNLSIVDKKQLLHIQIHR